MEGFRGKSQAHDDQLHMPESLLSLVVSKLIKKSSIILWIMEGADARHVAAKTAPFTLSESYNLPFRHIIFWCYRFETVIHVLCQLIPFL